MEEVPARQRQITAPSGCVCVEFHGVVRRHDGLATPVSCMVQAVDVRIRVRLAVGIRAVVREVPRSQRSRLARRCRVVARHAVGRAVGEQHDDAEARLLAARNRPHLVPSSIEAFDHVRAAARQRVWNVGR